MAPPKSYRGTIHPQDAWIETLLNEPFALHHHFNQLSLEDIGKLIESADQASDFDQSFEKCLEAYCLLVLSLEQEGKNLSEIETLYEIRQNNTKTHFISDISSLQKQVHQDDKSSDQIASFASLKNPGAKEYYNLALFLKEGTQTDFPLLSTALLRKLHGQALNFAMEAEAIFLSSRLIKNFQTHKDVALRSLIDIHSSKFDLNKNHKNVLGELAKKYKDWLFEEKFPLPMVLSSMQYLLSVNKLSQYRPNTVDIGVILFFFGQDEIIGGLQFQNLLGVSGLSSKQITELLFRITRCQKIKRRLLDVNLPVGSALLKSLDLDVERILVLLADLKIEDSSISNSHLEQDTLQTLRK